MLYFLIANNLHLGAELLGAVIFFLAAWLFGEAFWIKKDLFSLSRGIGFALLSLWQLFHALNNGNDALTANGFIYLSGLLLILISYGMEKMTAKPLYIFTAPIPLFLSINENTSIISAGILALITFFLAKRYFKDIDKSLKWLLIGFAALTVSSIAAIFAEPAISNNYWILEHAVKLAAFLLLSIWIWKFLSLRIREDALIVFIAISLFISLLVTTTFSVFFLKQIEQETENNLSASAQILNFYLDSLKNKALAASQIIASNEDFSSAIKTKDIETLKEMSRNLIKETNQDFLTVALKKGEILFKASFPINNEENALAEEIVAEALEGRPAVTIDEASTEGLSIRAAAPVYNRGAIIGAVISGSLLNKSFARQFKNIIGFETTIFKNGRVNASSFLVTSQAVNYPNKQYIGLADFSGQAVIGVFRPIKNINGENAATFSITTTPGELLINAQAMNRFTMIIIFSIILSLIIPLYRFSVFLTDETI